MNRYWAVTRLDHITRVWRSEDPFPEGFCLFQVNHNPRETKEVFKADCLDGKRWSKKSPTLSDCLLYKGDFPGVCKYLKDNGYRLHLEVLIDSMC